MNLIHFAILSKWDFIHFRLGGPGLGNLLFPLYRALQNQIVYGGEIIFPQFRQIKIGPFLRKEKDKRTYGNIFWPRSKADILLQFKSLTQKSILENDLNKNVSLNIKESITVKYFGLNNYFHDLEPEYIAEFNKFLLAKVKSRRKIDECRQLISENNVAIHLRLGDFSYVNKGHPDERRMNARVPIEWYGKIIHNLINQNPNLVFTVFTDEKILSQEQLNILGKPAIDTSDNALEAILRMSFYPILIGSQSTFSLWAAFLGQSTIILPSGFDVMQYTSKDKINYVEA